VIDGLVGPHRAAVEQATGLEVIVERKDRGDVAGGLHRPPLEPRRQLRRRRPSARWPSSPGAHRPTPCAGRWTPAAPSAGS